MDNTHTGMHQDIVGEGMREIKFRAVVNGAEGVVVSTDSFSVEELASYEVHEWRFSDGSTLPANDVIEGDLTYIQFTGLKDKNGTEIYEGDILGREEDRDFVFVVDFSSGSGKFSGVTKPGNHHRLDLYEAMTLDRAPYVEVIGNIYENPELLLELQKVPGKYRHS